MSLKGFICEPGAQLNAFAKSSEFARVPNTRMCGLINPALCDKHPFNLSWVASQMTTGGPMHVWCKVDKVVSMEAGGRESEWKVLHELS
ncbi:Protein of unknown function [Gryllus bimaculatus]|nr:Protein of unknown function [Gryllus bimaculatus]